MKHLLRLDQWIIFGILALLMLATRNNHFASLHALPGASWAVFFIAGFYLQPKWVLAALMAMAGAVDLQVYLSGAGSEFCFTRSYVFLLPAYAAMWFGGRWYRAHHQLAMSNLPTLALSVFASSAVCELLSGGSFYFLSAQIENPSLMGYFMDNFLVYFPDYLSSVVFYVVAALLVHLLVCSIKEKRSEPFSI